MLVTVTDLFDHDDITELTPNLGDGKVTLHKDCLQRLPPERGEADLGTPTLSKQDVQWLSPPAVAPE